MRKLDIHISDIVEKIDLKIFEEDVDTKTIFTFEINDSRDDSKVILKLEEKVAALLFEGLNHIFIENDDEVDVDTADEKTFELFEKFFEILNQKDNEHFGYEDEQ
ncbi:MAG: hypothetical protein ACI4VQ_06000 [Clostridia bacterium]